MNTRFNFKKTNKIGKTTIFRFYPPNSFNYSHETPPDKNNPYAIGIASIDMKKRQLVPKPLEEKDKEVKLVPLKAGPPLTIKCCYTDDMIKEMNKHMTILVDNPEK